MHFHVIFTFTPPQIWGQHAVDGVKPGNTGHTMYAGLQDAGKVLAGEGLG